MMNVAKIYDVIHGLKPVLLMVLVQIMSAASNVLYKLAASDGMHLSILIAYRFLFATAFICPIALFVERKKRPKLTWMILLQGFGCGLFGGSFAQNLYIKAMALTSATFVSATTNLIPAITFVFAVCFGMERLGWMTNSGTAKIIGTILGISGAMLLTFYKGVELHIWKTNVNLLHGQHNASSSQHSSNSLMGSLLAIISCFGYSIWLILQTIMMKNYPCPYSVTALTSAMSAVQSLVYGLSTERHWDDWKLGWNVRLLTVAFSGVIGSGLMFTLTAWCVQMRGPLFASSFSPLMLILVAVTGSLVLNENLHLGSILGGILIILGLYAVLWGKSKEGKKVAQLRPIQESNIETGDDVVDGESMRSSFEVLKDGVSKHSRVLSGNTEPRHTEVVVIPSI